jgi:hypothetical protein
MSKNIISELMSHFLKKKKDFAMPLALHLKPLTGSSLNPIALKQSKDFIK